MQRTNTMHVDRRTDTHIHTHHSKLLYKHDGHFCFGQQSHNIIKYAHGYSISLCVVTRRESAHSERSRCVNWCLMFPWQTKCKLMHTLTHSISLYLIHTRTHTHTQSAPGRRATAVGGTVRERGRERISAVCRPYMESSPSRPIMIFVTNLPDTLQRSDRYCVGD